MTRHLIIRSLKQLIRSIDCFTERTGQLIAWLTFGMMTCTCGVVVMRYFLGIGSIALQESITYMHALTFMLGAAFTLKHNGHVRVDILYQKLSHRGQALINTIGGVLFLIPVCLFIFILCWDYVLNSWAVREVSKEARGLPLVYALKTLLLIMPITLLLQGVAETLRNLLFVCGIHAEQVPLPDTTI